MRYISLNLAPTHPRTCQNCLSEVDLPRLRCFDPIHSIQGNKKRIELEKGDKIHHFNGMKALVLRYKTTQKPDKGPQTLRSHQCRV